MTSESHIHAAVDQARREERVAHTQPIPEEDLLRLMANHLPLAIFNSLTSTVDAVETKGYYISKPRHEVVKLAASIRAYKGEEMNSNADAIVTAIRNMVRAEIALDAYSRHGGDSKQKKEWKEVQGMAETLLHNKLAELTESEINADRYRKIRSMASSGNLPREWTEGYTERELDEAVDSKKRR